MRYHAHMEFRVDGELAGEYRGEIGTIVAIDFSCWTITLRFPPGYGVKAFNRAAVTLVNHERCLSNGCKANIERTEREP